MYTACILIKTHTIELDDSELFILSKNTFLLQITLKIVNNLVFRNFFCLFDTLYPDRRAGRDPKGGWFANISRIIVSVGAVGAAAPTDFEED